MPADAPGPRPLRREAVPSDGIGPPPGAAPVPVPVPAPPAAAPRWPPWRRFLGGGIPEYLARHYWWAYLWRPGLWFFDHGPVIDAILLGQYRRIADATIDALRARPAGRLLQVACVYGELTPRIRREVDLEALHVVDVARVQLDLCRRKLAGEDAPGAVPAHLARMNAEALGFADRSFDTVVLFFLLHELPPASRAHALAECARVLRPGGRLVIAEYGALTPSQPLHRSRLARRVLGRLEPFLPRFWIEDLDASLERAAGRRGLHPRAERRTRILGGFYRVDAYRLDPARAA